jgi:hypothetical protein
VSIDLAARLRGLIFQLREGTPITRQQLEELKEIARAMEKAHAMSEPLRINLYGLLSSIEVTSSGSLITRDWQTYRSCLIELHAIIDEIRPRTADELRSRR